MSRFLRTFHSYSKEEGNYACQKSGKSVSHQNLKDQPRNHHPQRCQESLNFTCTCAPWRRRVVRKVIETVMIEELDALIGAAWGECNPKRKGYRNGSYTRDLVTSTGRIEDIKVRRRS